MAYISSYIINFATTTTQDWRTSEAASVLRSLLLLLSEQDLLEVFSENAAYFLNSVLNCG